MSTSRQGSKANKPSRSSRWLGSLSEDEDEVSNLSESLAERSRDASYIAKQQALVNQTYLTVENEEGGTESDDEDEKAAAIYETSEEASDDWVNASKLVRSSYARTLFGLSSESSSASPVARVVLVNPNVAPEKVYEDNSSENQAIDSSVTSVKVNDDESFADWSVSSEAKLMDQLIASIPRIGK